MSFLLLAANLSLATSHRPIPSSPISPDRPTITNSVQTVPLGWTQIEAGFTAQRVPKGSLVDLPEISIRYGLTTNLEFRVAPPNFGTQSVGGTDSSGLGDTTIGLKYELGPSRGGADLCLIPLVTLPSDQGPLSSHSTDPGLQVVWQADAGQGFTFSAMSSIISTIQSHVREGLFQQTADLGHDLKYGFAWFGEYAVSCSQVMLPQHTVDTGLTYLVGKNSQADIRIGMQAQGKTALPLVGIGYSVRF
jgi:hypothetical protein